jgi:hypothetical protein
VGSRNFMVMALWLVCEVALTLGEAQTCHEKRRLGRALPPIQEPPPPLLHYTTKAASCVWGTQLCQNPL